MYVHNWTTEPGRREANRQLNLVLPTDDPVTAAKIAAIVLKNQMERVEMEAVKPHFVLWLDDFRAGQMGVHSMHALGPQIGFACAWLASEDVNVVNSGILTLPCMQEFVAK
jgi:hypothetical protein